MARGWGGDAVVWCGLPRRRCVWYWLCGAFLGLWWLCGLGASSALLPDLLATADEVLATADLPPSMRIGKVKIYDLSLNWNHIHAIIYFKDKDFYVKFIRALCSILVTYFSNKLKKDLKGLFDLRPFTKIISWGPQFKNALNYVTINQMESWGLIKREKKSPKKKNKPLREKRNKLKT